MTKLTALDLRGNNISDISALSGMSNMQVINLSNNNIFDFSPINGKMAPSVAYLDKQGNRWPIKCSTAGLYTGLVNNLRYNNGTSVSGRELLDGWNDSELTLYIYESEANLVKKLDLNNAAHCNFGDTIRIFRNLEELYINNNKEMTNISGFEYLNKLRVLQMDNCWVSDISPLASCTNLKQLSFKYNNILNTTPLNGLTLDYVEKRYNGQIVNLECGNNFEPLRNVLTNYIDWQNTAPTGTTIRIYQSEQQEVKSIDLKNTKVDNEALKIVAQFPNLQVLDVQSTNVTSFKNISGCRNLRWFNSSNNKINTLDGLQNLNLYGLYIYNLKTDDVVLERNVDNYTGFNSDTIDDTAELPQLMKDIVSGEYVHLGVNKSIVEYVNCGLTEDNTKIKDNKRMGETYITFKSNSPLKGTKINLIKLMNHIIITLDSTSQAGKIKAGDVDLNGIVDEYDARLILQSCAEDKIKLDDKELQKAKELGINIVKDNKVTLRDYVKIRYILKNNLSIINYKEQDFEEFFMRICDYDGDGEVDTVDAIEILRKAQSKGKVESDGQIVDSTNWVGAGEVIAFKENVMDANTTNKKLKYSVKDGYTLNKIESKIKSIIKSVDGKITQITTNKNQVYNVTESKVELKETRFEDNETKEYYTISFKGKLQGTQTISSGLISGVSSDSFSNVEENSSNYTIKSSSNLNDLDVSYEYLIPKDANKIIQINSDGTLQVIGDGDDIVTIVATPADVEQYNDSKYGNVRSNGTLKASSEITVKVVRYANYIEISGLQDGVNALTGEEIRYTEEMNSTGDVNMDGLITTYDARLVLKYYVGLIEFTKEQKLIADVDANGKVNAMDAVEILRKADKGVHILRKADYIRENDTARLRDNLDPNATLKETTWTSSNKDVAEIESAWTVFQGRKMCAAKLNLTQNLGRTTVTATSEDGCVSDDITFNVVDLIITDDAPKPEQWTNKSVKVTISTECNISGGQIEGIYKRKLYDEGNLNNNLIGEITDRTSSEEREEIEKEINEKYITYDGRKTFSHIYTDEGTYDDLIFVYKYTNPNTNREEQIVKQHVIDLTKVIDKTPPECEVIYNTFMNNIENYKDLDHKTNYNVYAKIHITNNDTIANSLEYLEDGWKQDENNCIYKKYTDNTIQKIVDEKGNQQLKVVPEKVLIRDLAGNETIVDVAIDNMDVKGPVVQAAVKPELYGKIDGSISNIGMILKIIEDDDLKDNLDPIEEVKNIRIYKDGEDITNTLEKTENNAYRIMENGFYKILAEDEMSNKSETNFIINSDYKKINIWKPEQLEIISKMSKAGQTFEGYTIQLREDISLKNICNKDLGNWIPIGSDETPFAGTFKGKGHTISGVYIFDKSAQYLGLFGNITGKFENLGIFGILNGGNYITDGRFIEQKVPTITLSEDSNTEGRRNYKIQVNIDDDSELDRNKKLIGRIINKSNNFTKNIEIDINYEDETAIIEFGDDLESGDYEIHITNISDIQGNTISEIVKGPYKISKETWNIELVEDQNVYEQTSRVQLKLVTENPYAINLNNEDIEFVLKKVTLQTDENGNYITDSNGKYIIINGENDESIIESIEDKITEGKIDENGSNKEFSLDKHLFTVKSNGFYIAEVRNTNGESIATYELNPLEVTHVDTEAPNIDNINFNKKNNTLNIEISAIDNLAGVASLMLYDSKELIKEDSEEAKDKTPEEIANSGFKDMKEIEEKEQTSVTVEIPEVEELNSYVLKIKDKAGNEKYSENISKVNLHTNNAELSSEDDVYGYIEGRTLDLPTKEQISKAGCEFDGWYDNINFSGKKISQISSNDTGSKQYYAKWIGKTHTVNFVDENDKNIASINFLEGDESLNEESIPKVPEKEGYAGRWSEFKLGTTDITVKPIYEKINQEQNVYNITFNTNGGILLKEIKSYKAGENVQLPTNSEIEKQGYEFAGWYANKNFTGDKIEKIDAKDTGAKQYYAKWNPIKYIATFIDDSGERKVEFTLETSIKEPKITEKTGYISNWDKYSIKAENMTIKAIYNPVTYTATFKADNNIISIQTFTVENKEDVKNPEIPEREGYTAKWEKYQLDATNITINAIYEKIQNKVEVNTEDNSPIKDIKETNTNRYLIIKDNTTVKDLLNNLQSMYNISIKDENNKDMTENDIVGTNKKVIVNNNEIEFVTIVKGDVNFDGKVDMRDLLKVNTKRLEKIEFNEIETIAGNVVDTDDKIDMKDLLKINKYRLNIIENLY